MPLTGLAGFEGFEQEQGKHPTIWQITVRSANGHVHTHCTRWDPRRDRDRGTARIPTSASTIRCPRDGAGAEEYQVQNPDTGDVFDRARCTHCGHSRGLDPGAPTPRAATAAGPEIQGLSR